MLAPLKIVSMGKYLPARQITAAELEQRMGLEPGWIEAKSGVSIRHFATQDSNSSMGAQALQEALQRAELRFEDLDLLINASGSYDQPIPDTACLIQRALGKGDSGVPCFTVDATCLSFITALDVAAAFLSSGRYRRIAIVSSEIASKSLNYQDKETASLLGDGAAAAIVERSEAGESSALLSCRMETYGTGAFYTQLPGGGNLRHPLDGDLRPEEYTFQMNGLAILTIAFKRLRGFVKQLFGPLDFKLQEVDLFVPHQASKVALEKAQSFFKLSDAQFVNHLATHGNCIAASIPMALYDAIEAGRAERGQHICLLGTGAGLSLGGAVLRF